MSENTKPRGVDLSGYNAIKDYGELKRLGYTFAIIKAVGSRGAADKFAVHAEGCGKAGLNIGSYIYSYARSKAAAEKEALIAVNEAKPFSLDLPIWLDLEDTSLLGGLTSEERTANAEAALAVITNAGYRAGVYANPDWLENKLVKSRIIGKYPLWLAHWTHSPDKPSKYAESYNADIWQWGCDKLGGADVDSNIALHDIAAGNPTPPPKVSDKYKVYVYGSVLNIREEPGLSAPKAGTPLADLTEVTAYLPEDVRSVNGQKWLYVYVPSADIYGWVVKTSLVRV
ncbi:MAG: hypothetical protein LBN40_03090 [Oscillospiraceae bacterium]|jgi:hypothetical protein|nr:hypothetical protein [Oscillospiraceae bacterium]